MSPEELAKRHPRLYHVTEAGSWPSIKRHGLLSTSSLLDLFEVKGEDRKCLETQRRPACVPLVHPDHGRVILNDNVPLVEKALEKCLEEGLSSSDWMQILNARVFFWGTEERLQNLLNAKLNRGRKKEVLVVDALSLASAYAEKIELCAINSGVTFRKAARRGPSTFTPLLKHSYSEWSSLRGKKDSIQEVTVLGGIPDIAAYVLDVMEHG